MYKIYILFIQTTRNDFENIIYSNIDASVNILVVHKQINIENSMTDSMSPGKNLCV